MKSWQIVKLGQVQVGSNIAQNHSSNPYSWSLFALIHMKRCIDQKLTYVKFKSIWTLLRITHLTHRKSYLIIIYPNSLEKLTKSGIR